MWSDKLGAAIKAASVKPYPIEAHQGTETFRALVAAIRELIRIWKQFNSPKTGANMAD